MLLTIILVTSVIVSIILFCNNLKTKLSYWELKGVPQDTIKNVLINQIRALFGFRSHAETWADVYMRHKNSRYYGDYQLQSPILFLRDPELIKAIFVKDFDSFTNRRTFASADADPIWSNGLFQLQGSRWRSMRTILTPAYTGAKMRSMFLLIDEAARNFVNHYKSGPNQVVIETKDTFKRFTSDVIATCAFGLECDSLADPDNAIYRMAQTTQFRGFWRTLKIMIAQTYPQLTKFLKVEFFQKDVREFFLSFVTENVKIREDEGVYRGDMIDLLIEARRALNFEQESTPEMGKANSPHSVWGLTNEVMTAQVMNFFTAGFDTTSTVLTFCSYELAINADVQKRLREEIDAILIAQDNVLTYDLVNQMTYLDMVVSESMRKWPPALNIGRCCTKPYRMPSANENTPDLIIHAGENILVSIFAVHRDPENYPEPDLFNPERFNDLNKKQLSPYCYLPFGVGPRQCIAVRFSVMEIKTILVHLLSNFELFPVGRTQIPVKLSKNQLNLSPENGMWLGIRKRMT